MKYTFEYLEYVGDFGRWKDKSRRSYVSFGDIYSEIEFTKACSSKVVISLSKIIISISRIFILRIKVGDMNKTC